MRKIFMSVALLAATSMLIVSCKKGDVGPQGPAGPAGPTGQTGATGPIGTANVIYSSWFKFQTTDWADSTAPLLGAVKRANKFTSSMTQAIVDNGLVMSYIKYDEAGQPLMGPFQLPVSVPVTGGQVVFTTIPAVGRLVFVGYSIPSGGASLVNTIQFRYIIIPGGISGRGETPTYNGYTAEELKNMPYERVVSLFNIPAEGSN